MGVAPFGAYYQPQPSVIVVGGRKLLQEAAPGAAQQQQAAPACKTVKDVLAQTPNLSALNGMAERLSAPLKAELTSKAGPAFTFFAPTDKAIQTLLASLPNAGAELASNQTALTALLSHHIVTGSALSASQLKDGQQLSTALKAVPPLRVRLVGGAVAITSVGSEAGVIQADIKTCRGIVHVIDTVLLPVNGAGQAQQAQAMPQAAAPQRG